MQRQIFLWFLFGLLALLAACEQQPTSTDTGANLLTPASTGSAVTPASLPTPAVAATQTAQVTPRQQQPVVSDPTRTLIIWLPPEIATRTATGADTFLSQLAEITAEYPNLEVRIEQKTVSGQGGMLSYLRTGRLVAPRILPDLIILPIDQLTTTLNDGLIYPLNGLLDESLMETLYPAALALAQPDSQIMGYPLALTGLSHLAYRTGTFADAPVNTWEELLALSGQSFLITGAGRSGAIFALQLYLDAGGQLVNEAGQPSLQVEPLTRALEPFSAGRAAGLISSQSSVVATSADSWQLYTNGAASMVQTTADHLLITGIGGRTPGFAPLPGLTGPLAPLISGWAWAVSTPEPGQQALAVEIMQAMLEENRLAEWSYQSGILPSRRSALALWPTGSSYTEFLGEQLEVARPFPAQANNTIMGILGNAVLDVLSRAKTPQAAAEEAAAALQP